MTDWVVRTTFDVDPDEATMDAWETALDERGVDGSLSRIPKLHQATMTVYLPISDMIKATCEGCDLAAEIIGRPPIGVETITEDEQQRRADEPTLPELMSAAEIAEELGVARQRVHQLRSTAAFPSPLAELRGGAIWDAAAVRKFAHDWERKPGRPRQSRRTAYRKPDGRLIDLTYLESRGVSLTQADIDRMPPEELDRILREYE
nr:hypothetical protein [Mycolicibacterium pyrenivorans]